MKVDGHRAVTKELAGETYYFCSDRCLHAFEAAPQHAHLEQIASR
jgi:YHS domain-containing protein